ncbi:hypothetical protein [Acrocarpospora catenulata]|uniref:hypothetical protein n=1 Tax=Acrocarpospora catenulata TaxID=2836182 RepID=UPI001BDB3EE3|nr:hypothetical protein [Acrocarpospora catenulata]
MHSAVSAEQQVLEPILAAVRAVRDGSLRTSAQRLAHVAELRKHLAKVKEALAADAAAGSYFKCLAVWIEASPVTSAALAGVALDRDDVQSLGPAWVEAYVEYLTAVVTRLKKAPAPVSEAMIPFRERILQGIRRAGVTVGADRRLCAISDVKVRRLRRAAVHLLLLGENGPQLELRQNLLTYQPTGQIEPEDLKAVPLQVDFGNVPGAERQAVAEAVFQAVATGGPKEIPGRFIWPLTIRAQGGRVRYELVFAAVDGDQPRQIRPERLGEATGWAVPGYVGDQNGVDARRNALIRRFALGGVEDRRTARWSADELGLVAAAFERLPPSGAEALRGVVLVRDGVTAELDAGVTRAGFTHINRHDVDAGDQLRPPPHVHYYNVTFDERNGRATGSPGDAGGGADFTLLHEAGHVVISCPRAWYFVSRNSLVRSYQETRDQFVARIVKQVATDDRPILVEWNRLSNPYTLAVAEQFAAADALCTAYYSCDPERVNAALREYQAKRTVAETAKKALLDSAALLDPVLPEGERLAVQITTEQTRQSEISDATATDGRRLYYFKQYAEKVRFVPFTAYGRTAVDEFFAETYALFLADRERLYEYNWRMCCWLEADFPDPDTFVPNAF